ncbi:MAG TPA: SUF system NifU family Fe-S cluster assembly protein [Candidatus Thermoplasmatota archaeon]|nr:SUF system NifU family Fe-S cluster assembly protein [Candidatus Thermoplasmatota archaeon]
MDEAMRDLYQDMILSHNKSPRNKRVLEGADRMQEGFNPLCGDRLTLFLKLDGERIADIAFTGHGCAIDTASASMMTEAVKGKTVPEALAMYEHFHHLVLRDAPADTKALGKLAAFSGVGEFPARVKCATLPWHTLRATLRDEKRPVSTE